MISVLLNAYIRIIELVSKRVSRERAEEIIKDILSKHKFHKKINVRFTHFDGASHNSYDPRTETVELDADNLFEAVILHELGHAHYSVVRDSANFKLKAASLSKKPKWIDAELIIDAEKEAWKFAEDNYSRRWGFRMKRMKGACLNTYRWWILNESEFK